jgi:hypothetical protein
MFTGDFGVHKIERSYSLENSAMLNESEISRLTNPGISLKSDIEAEKEKRTNKK